MSSSLKCQECDVTQDIPHHCGQAMHIEDVGGKEMLVCWMGPSCGKQEIPTHHGKPMTIS